MKANECWDEGERVNELKFSNEIIKCYKSLRSLILVGCMIYNSGFGSTIFFLCLILIQILIYTIRHIL